MYFILALKVLFLHIPKQLQCFESSKTEEIERLTKVFLLLCLPRYARLGICPCVRGYQHPRIHEGLSSMSKSQGSRNGSELPGVVFPSGQGREQVHHVLSNGCAGLFITPGRSVLQCCPRFWSPLSGKDGMDHKVTTILEESLAEVSCITTGLDFTHGEHSFSFTLNNQICQACLWQPDLIKCSCCSTERNSLNSAFMAVQRSRDCHKEEPPFTILFVSLPSASKWLILSPELSTILHCKHQE
ncbi:uncharacterized protein LOC116782623 [Chiroxiphia lanceolata]|uniref:uncharacterized protein LOC116782623 n=1 Tax=Chiroxiphia lanceolata TaxID=296741 RepID=UPI0013CEEF19|nr:uncharacterized protein LOC116782623 [Chiroxiphia lanceolata]